LAGAVGSEVSSNYHRESKIAKEGDFSEREKSSMNWTEFAVGACLVGAIILIGKLLTSSKQQEEVSKCRFIPKGRIVIREYEGDIIELIKRPPYECYIKEE
jgi:hypothetical protein